MQNDHTKSVDNNSKTTPPKQQEGSKAMAGGFFIALFTLIGFFIGAFNGQVSIGALAGFVTGGIIALIIWIMDRKK